MSERIDYEKTLHCSKLGVRMRCKKFAYKIMSAKREFGCDSEKQKLVNAEKYYQY